MRLEVKFEIPAAEIPGPDCVDSFVTQACVKIEDAVKAMLGLSEYSVCSGDDLVAIIFHSSVTPYKGLTTKRCYVFETFKRWNKNFGSYLTDLLNDKEIEGIIIRVDADTKDYELKVCIYNARNQELLSSMTVCEGFKDTDYLSGEVED